VEEIELANLLIGEITVGDRVRVIDDAGCLSWCFTDETGTVLRDDTMKDGTIYVRFDAHCVDPNRNANNTAWVNVVGVERIWD